MSRFRSVSLLVATVASLMLVSTVFLSLNIHEEQTELVDKHGSNAAGLQVSHRSSGV